MIVPTKRIVGWAFIFTPLVSATAVVWLSSDPWRWGTVGAVCLAIICEVWNGYCQHGGSIVEGRRNLGMRYIDDKLPWLERLFTRDEVIRQSAGGLGRDAFTEVRAVPRFGARSVAHSPVVRGVGRLTLAGFVVAGFAAGQFEIPWFTAS